MMLHYLYVILPKGHHFLPKNDVISPVFFVPPVPFVVPPLPFIIENAFDFADATDFGAGGVSSSENDSHAVSVLVTTSFTY